MSEYSYGWIRRGETFRKGFMIKEMGDGFLCSVGYPFQPAQSLKPSESAVILAEEMMDLFSRTLGNMDCQSPIHCSIGLASGYVKGYFSKSGSIRYDLWGESLIHATRYEALRKTLFARNILEKSSIVTLQYKLYEDLDPSVRSTFQTLDLKEYGLYIRDDAEAEYVAVRQWDIVKPTKLTS